jgi:hypothetical protein
MITVKKDAIKYKTSEGMQSAGVLCNVGTFGEDLIPLFESVVFSSEITNRTENLELNLVNASIISNLIDQRIINFEKLTITVSSKCTSFQYAFRSPNVLSSGKLKTIEIKGDMSGVTNMNGAFNNRTNLIEIIGELDFTNITSGTAFTNCRKLQEVRFVKNSISISLNISSTADLSDTSTQSTIDGLADLTGQTARTITFHKDIEAKLSDEQKAQITSKNWTLAFSK